MFRLIFLVQNVFVTVDVIFLPKREQLEFHYWNVKIILRIWFKFRKDLISDFPPLSSFLEHPSFQQAQLASKFDAWQKTGMHRFCDLGDSEGMFSQSQLGKKLNNNYISQFQYLQVSGLVHLLNRTCCFSSFEWIWSIDIDKQKKILSKLYNRLISC